jgi:hypothetical protein
MEQKPEYMPDVVEVATGIKQKGDRGAFIRHQRALRIIRYRTTCKAMPAHKNTLQQIGRKKLAWGWIQLCNRRQYNRIVWPWQPRPLDPKVNPAARVQRGRSSNPTALCQLDT